MCYAKVILAAYPRIGNAVKEMDRSVRRRCFASFDSKIPCAIYAEKIAKIIENKEKLLLLKDKVSKVLKRLTDEEMILIGYKYFKNRPIDGFDYKSRQYFRRQNKAFSRFKEMLSYINLTESVFVKDYSKIPFIKSIQTACDDEDLNGGVEYVKEVFGQD